jgi:hypothetical protein
MAINYQKQADWQNTPRAHTPSLRHVVAGTQTASEHQSSTASSTALCYVSELLHDRFEHRWVHCSAFTFLPQSGSKQKPSLCLRVVRKCAADCFSRALSRVG